MNDTNTVNWIVTAMLVCIGAACTALMYVPELMDSVAMKLRARARAMRASREHWRLAYRESIHADMVRDEETAQLKRMITGR